MFTLYVRYPFTTRVVINCLHPHISIVIPRMEQKLALLLLCCNSTYVQYTIMHTSIQVCFLCIFYCSYTCIMSQSHQSSWFCHVIPSISHVIQGCAINIIMIMLTRHNQENAPMSPVPDPFPFRGQGLGTILHLPAMTTNILADRIPACLNY